MKKIHDITPIHLVASNDDLRPAMMFIEIRKGIATATNGHILVRKYFESLKNIELLYVHKDDFKMIYDSISFQIIDNNKFELFTKLGKITLIPREFTELRYPNYFPTFQSFKDKSNSIDEIPDGFDPNLVANIYKAGGINYLDCKMVFTGNRKPIFILHYNEPFIGLVMPYTMETYRASGGKPFSKSESLLKDA